MSVPGQRDADFVQAIAKLQADVDALRSIVVGRWGRVPTDPAVTPPDGSLWIDQSLPALMGRANGATFAAATSERTGVILTDSAQTIATGTLTDITWGAESSDPHGWHAAGAAALVVPAGRAGRYAITLRSLWASDPVDAKASLHVNGSHVGSISHLSWHDYQHLLNFSCLYLAAGASLVFSVWHAAGANRAVSSTVEIAWIGP